jgi:hypothetical protein
MSPFDGINTKIQAIEGEGQSERPTNHEPKRTYPIRSDTTDRKEDIEAKRSCEDVRDKRKACQAVVESVSTIRSGGIDLQTARQAEQ